MRSISSQREQQLKRLRFHDESMGDMSVTVKCSLGKSELSGLEVVGLLGDLESLELKLVLGEAGTGSLGALESEVHGHVSRLLVGLLGLGSSHLVDDGKMTGDGLSDNLKFKRYSR